MSAASGDLPFVDDDVIVAWIAEQTDIEPAVVVGILEIEFEYQIAVGIADAPGYVFKHYDRREIEGESAVVDTGRLAKDAHRLLGIDEELAHQVFDAELRFLEQRGLATPAEGWPGDGR